SSTATGGDEAAIVPSVRYQRSRIPNSWPKWQKTLSLESIFDKRQVVAPVVSDVHAHNRESDGAVPPGERTVLGGRRRKRAALLRADPLQGRAERVGGTGPHLHHDQLPSPAADQGDPPAPRDQP